MVDDTKAKRRAQVEAAEAAVKAEAERDAQKQSSAATETQP